MSDLLSGAIEGVLYKLVFLPLLGVPYLAYLISTSERRKKAPDRPGDKDKPAN